MTTEREPEADAVLRRELANLRAAWRLARGRGSRRRRRRDVTALFDAVAYRDLVEIRGWAEELAERPGARRRIRARPPCWAPAAEAAYHRGDYAAGRAARPRRARPRDRRRRRRGTACSPLSVAAAGPRGVRRGRRALPRRRRARRPAAREPRHRRPRHGLRRRSRPGAGAERPRAAPPRSSPTMRAWGAYVAGEIESLPATPSWPSSTTCGPSTWPATSGATFLVGVATVGPAHRARPRPDASARRCAATARSSTTSPAPATGPTCGRPCATSPTCCAGSVTTSRRRCCDAAADQAPDAPAVDRPPAATRDPGRVDRAATEVLEVAREAIERNLSRRASRPATRSPDGAPPRRTTPRRPTPCSTSTPRAAMRPAVWVCLRGQGPDLAGGGRGSSTRSTASRSGGVTTG